MKLASIGEALSEKVMFENNCHILVYSPRVGADNPLGSNLNILLIWSFAARFTLLMTL